MAIFYRTNFLSNIFEIIQFIKDGNVLINWIISTNLNSSVSISSFITCYRYTFKRLHLLLLRCLKDDIILFNTPKFLFISYYFLFAIIIKPPIKKDFVYPFALDIQRITGYN